MGLSKQILNNSPRIQENVQRLRALADLVEGLGFVPWTDMVTDNHLELEF